MKNKKGFTLIELIAVIVIIGLIALIAVPFFTGSLEDFRKNFYVNLNTTFLSGGKEFFSDNSKYLPRRYLFAQKVTLSTLQNEKYVKSFKDYKGNECDLENSYVIVVKLGDKSYEYVPCLKCPQDSYENNDSKYCKPEWLDNGNIEHTLGNIDTLYIYKGTSREVLKERAKVSLDIVKYNGAREEVARVSGVGEEGIESVSPSNLDIVDTNKVGEYTLDYTYQEKTIHGLVVVYENPEPIVIAKRNQYDKDKTKPVESTDTVANDSEYDKSTYDKTPDDVWAQELLYEISSDSLTVPGTTIVEYQWYIHERWETFCKPTDGLKCTHIVNEEMNETVWFRSIDSLGNISNSDITEIRPYVVRIDRTKPTCTLNVPTPDGNQDGATKWYRNDFNITFASTSDTAKQIHGNSVTSGLVESYLKVAVDGTRLDKTGLTTTGTQTEDDSSFIWYGYVEDKAGNWYTCNSGTLKKDKTPPSCTVTGNPDSNANPSTAGVTGTYKCVDATSGCTDTNTKSYSNKKETSEHSMTDKAGNTGICKVEICKQVQSKTYKCTSEKSCSEAGCKTAKSCTKSCCGTYSCNCSTCGGGCKSHAGACVGGNMCGGYGKNSCENGGHGGYAGNSSSCGWDSNAGTCTSYYPKYSCNCQTCNSSCTSESCCGCQTYNSDATKCGCNTWSEGSWVNNDNCSASNCTNSDAYAKSRRCCRDTYYLCGNQTISLTYDNQGGTGCTSKNGTLSNKWGTLCTPTRSGYTFKGWYTEPNGEGTQITANTIVTGSLLVYAKWDGEYVLTYDNQGGTGCTSKIGIYGYAWGDLCIPTKAGYKFDSWKTATGETIDSNSIVSSSLTVYAQYTPYILFITYNVSGGTYVGTNTKITISDEGDIYRDGSNYYKSYNYGATGIDLANYNNSDYINITNTGYKGKSSEEWYDNNRTYSQSASYKYSDICSSTTADCYVNLYVNWVPITYKISFNGNGNTGGTTADKTCTYDQDCTLTSNGFTKTGYTFVNWTYNGDTYNNGEIVSNLTSTDNATITMTANWRANCSSGYTYNSSNGKCEKTYTETAKIRYNGGTWNWKKIGISNWSTVATWLENKYASRKNEFDNFNSFIDLVDKHNDFNSNSRNKDFLRIAVGSSESSCPKCNNGTLGDYCMTCPCGCRASDGCKSAGGTVSCAGDSTYCPSGGSYTAGYVRRFYQCQNSGGTKEYYCDSNCTLSGHTCTCIESINP